LDARDQFLLPGAAELISSVPRRHSRNARHTIRSKSVDAPQSKLRATRSCVLMPLVARERLWPPPSNAGRIPALHQLGDILLT
jgi:hypothetical protein